MELEKDDEDMAAQQLIYTRDIDDTQMVEATQDTQTCGDSQKVSFSLDDSQIVDEEEETEKSKVKDDMNPLKDVSNILKRTSVPKYLKTDFLSESNTKHLTSTVCTEDVPDTEAIVFSQASNTASDENDLTPEITVNSKTSEHKVAGLSQLSTSSEHPVSSSSGSGPSSSQLSSSSDNPSSSQQNNRLTPTQPKNAEDSVNLDATQDIFCSEEARQETSPQKLTPQEDSKNKGFLNILPVSNQNPSPVVPDEDKTGENKVLFKVPGGVSGISKKRDRKSRDKLLRDAMNEYSKASPPLDSQDVNLRVSGSGSENDMISPDELDDDLVPKTPETVDSVTPESGMFSVITPEKISRIASAVQQRETVKLIRKLVVTCNSFVDCEVTIDRTTGEIPSVQILEIKNITTQAEQLGGQSMSDIMSEIESSQRIRGPMQRGGSTDKGESMTALCKSYQTAVENTVIALIHKQFAGRMSLKKNETLELKKAPDTPVTFGRVSRKRKLSSSPAKENNSDDTMESSKKLVTTPSPSTPPSKRPRHRRFSGEREKTPKPKPPLPKLKLQLPPTSLNTTSYYLQQGTKVFAKWADKMYYPADIVKQTGFDHWHVRFFDDQEKELPSSSISIVNTLEINQPILAQSSKFYKKGTVVEVKAFDYMDEQYVVKFDHDGSLLELPRDKLSMTEQMIQAYRLKDCGSDVRPRGPIDLGNVLHGKRSRATPSPVPSSSSMKMGSDSKSKFTTSESSSCDETEKAQFCLNVTGVEREENNPDPLAGKGPKRARSRKKPLPDEERVINELGPVPEAGSNLFSGLTFILTCASTHIHDAKESHNPRLTGDTSDVEGSSETECFCEFTKINKLMSKSRLAEQLIAGGGRILTDLDSLDPKEENHEDIFLIANRPCQTAVYIHCLALGIKAVLFDAVINCCKKGLNFKQYINRCETVFYTGFSVKERRLVAWNEFRRKVTKPFHGATINIHSKDRAFVKYWGKILRSAGATTLRLKSKDDVLCCTVIVAEPPVTPILRSTALKWTIPIVSSKWIVQSLIHHEALPYNWHSDFRVDSEDSD